MKNILYLSIFVLLIACSGKKTANNSESQPSNSPTQWLDFEGKNKKVKHIENHNPKKNNNWKET